MENVGNTTQVTDTNTGQTTNSNTVDPSKREVTQRNIDDLHLNQLNYDSNGQASLGSLSNQYHP